MPEPLIIIGALAMFVVWLWALADAATKPDTAYQAAGKSKALWIVLIAVFGILGSAMYLLAIRPKLARETAASTYDTSASL